VPERAGEEHFVAIASPDPFNAFVREQVAELGKLVKISGAKPE
jgi:hypothetical protein